MHWYHQREKEVSNINEFRYINESLRITERDDPARGGKRVEARTYSKGTTVLFPKGIRREVTTEYWKDIGTIMNPTHIHVPEQPLSLAKRLLLERIEASRNGV